MDLYIDAVTEDFLPDEVLLNVLSFLDVESNLVVSLVSRRRISRDIRLWHTFCLNLVGQHAPLLHDMNSADYKQTYVTLCNKTPGEIYSFLMINWLLRRTKVPIRDPNFLQFNVTLYSARGTKNEVKQMLYFDAKESVECDGLYKMSFKPFPNQEFPPVFFFGEKGIWTNCDFVAVGRMLEPREKIIMNNVSLMARLQRNSGWHFSNSYTLANPPLMKLRVSPLSSKQLSRLGVATTCPRFSDSGHSHRWESTEDTSWRLRGSSSTISYNVGEVDAFQVCIHVEELFRAVNPSYFVVKSEEIVT